MDKKELIQETVEEIVEEVKEEPKVEPTPEVKEDPKPVEEPKVNRNELLRELSKEYGVNLFDTEGLQEFKKLQESKQSETEKLHKEIEELRQREQELKNKNESIRLEALRVQYGIDEDKYNDFLVLTQASKSEDETIEDTFKKTLEKYGDTFISKKPRENIRLGIQVEKDETNTNIKSFDEEVLESYFRRRKGR